MSEYRQRGNSESKEIKRRRKYMEMGEIKVSISRDWEEKSSGAVKSKRKE